jgi:hypothetical protein
MASLSAKENPLIVDRKAGETFQITEIQYEKLELETIWWRIGPGSTTPWRRRADPVSNDPDELKKLQRAGNFTSPAIAPGRLYQVLVMRDGADPNIHLPEGVSASLDVLCLLKEPEKTKLLKDMNGPEVGGTFFWVSPTTSEPAIMQLVIGTRPPDRIDGRLTFKPEDILDSTKTTLELSTNAELEISTLFPGNNHVAVVRLSDPFGNWEFLEFPFATLQRKTSVRWKEIDITNDGDPMDHSDASFDFEILEASSMTPNRKSRIVKSFHWDDGDIWDGKEITLSFSHDWGPQRINSENQFVTVNIRGEEFDGIFESNEHASNDFMGTLLHAPRGRGREVVIAALKTIWAKPKNGDFNFVIQVSYSMEYVP